MSCCGRQRTLMRETGTTAAPVDRFASAPAQNPAGTDGVRLRYLGSASVLVSGPATRRPYTFSPMQPTQQVDARDAIVMLRTRLFLRTW